MTFLKKPLSTVGITLTFSAGVQMAFTGGQIVAN